ncbi:TPA: hypothetical protein NKZ51_004024 [Vibrio parahaemolyticus]|uniref:hypothetical protein n=1 Tax=Vibrio TaxID=662 RepID=UPI002232A2A6|nr:MULTISPECIES: hypothetical protein [Vibrio]EJE4173850.1 hypothetical protein [Vibrio parahaemolyticus]MDF4936793.1 hypothetical protein [Vibrio parahaemolyticus]MDV6253607.1 hypothetical protein [Vibrio sp. EA2]BDR17903.1 hypothetical protein VspSTUT16_12490 [Vibrio sp. STUT-A16]HCH5588690.1 hypothetical protein [Vibrio parahaemolyticus]
MGFFRDLFDDITGETERRSKRVALWERETQQHVLDTRRKVIHKAYNLWVKRNDSAYSKLQTQQNKLENAAYLLNAIKQDILVNQAVAPAEKMKRIRRTKDMKPKQIDGLLKSARTRYPYPKSVTYSVKSDEFIQHVDTFMRKQLSGRKKLFAEWESFHLGVTDIYL